MTVASSLADRLIAGGAPATATELLDLLQNAPREELREAAHRVTEAFKPAHFDFCSIINARSGRCPENCKWCAQSAHWKTECAAYGWVGTEACVRAAKEAEANGADRIGIVTYSSSSPATCPTFPSCGAHANGSSPSGRSRDGHRFLNRPETGNRSTPSEEERFPSFPRPPPPSRGPTT